MWPTICDDPSIQAFYERCRENGTSDSLAQIFAFQQMPSLKGTDSAFWSGRWEDEDEIVTGYREQAAAQGISTKGKIYSGSLARYAGDPQAFVSDQHDVLAVAKKEGMTVRGAVNYKPPEGVYDPGPPQPYRVADDIVAREAEKYIERNPDATLKEAKSVMAEQLLPASEKRRKQKLSS